MKGVFFLSEIGSGFGEPGGGPSLRIPRNTPPPGPLCWYGDEIASNAPINVNPVGGSAGKGWGFDKF